MSEAMSEDVMEKLFRDWLSDRSDSGKLLRFLLLKKRAGSYLSVFEVLDLVGWIGDREDIFEAVHSIFPKYKEVLHEMYGIHKRKIEKRIENYITLVDSDNISYYELSFILKLMICKRGVAGSYRFMQDHDIGCAWTGAVIADGLDNSEFISQSFYNRKDIMEFLRPAMRHAIENKQSDYRLLIHIFDCIIRCSKTNDIRNTFLEIVQDFIINSHKTSENYAVMRAVSAQRSICLSKEKYKTVGSEFLQLLPFVDCDKGFIRAIFESFISFAVPLNERSERFVFEFGAKELASLTGESVLGQSPAPYHDETWTIGDIEQSMDVLRVTNPNGRPLSRLVEECLRDSSYYGLFRSAVHTIPDMGENGRQLLPAMMKESLNVRINDRWETTIGVCLEVLRSSDLSGFQGDVGQYLRIIKKNLRQCEDLGENEFGEYDDEEDAYDEYSDSHCNQAPGGFYEFDDIRRMIYDIENMI